MTHVGIDLGQFVSDPYTSGIQRVLQYLAREWPSEDVPCDFVVPHGREFLLLSPSQAATMLDAAFAVSGGDEVRRVVGEAVERLAGESPKVRPSELLSMYSAWLLPEVSYDPQVLDRLELFAKTMPCTMIGYDALPMTDPANYRFTPGSAAVVSEYFRLLTVVDSVVCISDYSRESILNRLRRHPSRKTLVAHPGGDHVPVSDRAVKEEQSPVTFLRVGTMEARKHPVEIVQGFQEARARGTDARLVFVGAPSASDFSINRAIEDAVENDDAFQWIRGASDGDVARWQQDADVFLSFGIEGYGIPVLESLRRGTPVLFGGTQPAAELMVGAGSRRIDSDGHQGLVAAFERFSIPDEVDKLLAQVRSDGVPKWTTFVTRVAETCSRV
jgi:glycosyltransferase involved in cell wall biosynthesis